MLSNPVDNKKMTIYDVTKEQDFVDPKTVDGIIRRLKGPGHVFFYCSLCTVGSTWQRLNLELANEKIGEDTCKAN